MVDLDHVVGISRYTSGAVRYGSTRMNDQDRSAAVYLGDWTAQGLVMMAGQQQVNTRICNRSVSARRSASQLKRVLPAWNSQGMVRYDDL